MEKEFATILPKTNIFAPKNGGFHNRNLLFQGSIFRGELLVSGRVIYHNIRCCCIPNSIELIELIKMVCWKAMENKERTSNWKQTPQY